MGTGTAQVAEKASAEERSSSPAQISGESGTESHRSELQVFSSQTNQAQQRMTGEL